MTTYGCTGTRVVEPANIAPSIERVRKEAERTSRPLRVEIMIERTEDAAMGTSLANVVEFEQSVASATAEGVPHGTGV
jgi:tartronate-semialdehyde synthase